MRGEASRGKRRRGEASSRGGRKRGETSRRRTSKKTTATIRTQGRRFE